MYMRIALPCLFILFVQIIAYPPSFDHQAQLAVVLPENITIGTLIKNFTITDRDPHDVIQVHVRDPTTNKYVNVTVNPIQGNNVLVSVNLRHSLDRDRGSSSIKLKFLISDTEGNEVPVEFVLYIQDVNDEAPQFQNEPYRFEIPENNETGIVYGKISASDIDSGTNSYVTFSMKPDSQSSATKEEYRNTFSIDYKNGNVSLLKKLDYEKNSYYQFTVTAQDMAPPYHQVSTILIIRVLDVQDTPPFFTGIPYRTTIQENTDIGTPVMTVSAIDGDPGVSNPVDFRFRNGNCSSYFNVSSNGQIVTAKRIDRDEGEIETLSGVCLFQIEAYEKNDSFPQEGNTTTVTDVTVIILDVNDNSPQFNNSRYNASVQENTPEGVPITLTDPVSMIVSDIDQGVNSRIHISLNTSCFTVVPEDIQDYGSILIRVANSSVLDYEKQPKITFQLIATERANTSHIATATVILELQDMNDNNPHFDKKSYIFNIDENSENATPVGNITATDEDSDLFGDVTYSLSGGNDQFVIGPKDGIIRTNCNSSALDRERLDVYYLSVTATDGGGRSNATSVIIHLNDVNDNKPTFVRQEYIASVAENDHRYNETPVITFTALDADKAGTDNSKVTYSIFNNSEPTVNLTINDTTGAVYLRSPVDYELLENTVIPGEVLIVVEARDWGSPVQNSTVILKLDVQDENDNSPKFRNTTFKGSVFENETSTIDNHTIVLEVNATDADKTEKNNKLDYFILSGSFEAFSINPSTGEVYITPNAYLDRETKGTYNMTINAIDHGSPPRTGTAHVFVIIKDVNDVSPKFNESSYEVQVPENQNSSNAVTCNAFDADEDHLLYFRIENILAYTEAGNEVNSSLVQNYFSIDDSDGSVSVSCQADREVAQDFKLEIIVSDVHAYNPSLQSVTTTLTVTLLDENDNPPEFDKRNYTFFVSENADDDTIITTIHASDIDINRTISYGLLNNDNGSYSASFEIESQTGLLRKTDILDREAVDQVELVITATDNGVPPLSSNLTVHIVVTDYNDNAPVFETHKILYKVPENATNGTVIGIINATDADIGDNGRITYAFQDGMSSSFTINEITGGITVDGNLDREATAIYTLTIVAKDNPKQNSEQKRNQTTIKIVLTDVNDNAPTFNKEVYFTSVKEDIKISSPVLTMLAEDSDEPDSNNSKVVYEVIAGNGRNFFKIDSQTGIIRSNMSLSDQVGNYTLTVMAADCGDPQMNGTATVNIQITDINQHNPVLQNPPPNSLVKTYECARVNSTVYHFNATDADHGMNAKLNYSISLIESNASVTNFWIDIHTGVLKTKTNFTDKGGEEYKLQLVVLDNGEPVLTTSPYIFTVEILDVNDHPPEFESVVVNMSVLENQINGTVGTATATDKDKNSVSCYSITESQWSNYFDIGNTSGIITTTKELDRENVTTSIEITVTVSDCSAPENKSEVCDNYTSSNDSAHQNLTVNIIILDEDDNPPVFTLKEILVGMRRNVEEGSLLNLQLKEGSHVTDKDTPANGRNKWIFKNNGEVRLGPEFKGSISGNGGINRCEDNITHLFCISKNGSITNNFWFNEDMSGFVKVPIMVIDGAGNDTAFVKIYLIADSQVLLMTVFGSKAEVANRKDDILKLFGDTTGHQFVYDDIADHKTDAGTIDLLRTDLFFHVVEPETNRILSADEAKRLVDQFSTQLTSVREKFKITQIVSSVRSAPQVASSEKTIYILVAAVVVLSLTLCIIVYLFCSSASRYRRKLKAATITSLDKGMEMKESRFEVPGSNQYSKQNNPLLNAEEPKLPQYDSYSLSSENSLDANEVDAARPDTVYDRIEEKEMTMDMYNDDEHIAIPEEDPLSAALRLHELRRSADNLDRHSVVDSEDGLVKMNGDVASNEKVIIHGFENAAFDNLEHSEI